ncbi:MAG: glycerol-3-phosphate 1-O-acyltransferase PlsY [Algisphaera sp.]
MNITPWLFGLLAAFLSGSIPFAVLIGHAKGINIRQHGSGNPGATNLGRAVGKKWGLFCFVLDVLKGLLPVLLFGRLIELGVSASPAMQWVSVAVAAVAGHIFSPWLGFKGGKGVATGLGATLGLFPIVTLPGGIAFALWYAVAKLSGYVGLASVIAAASLPVSTFFNAQRLGLTAPQTTVFTLLTATLAALVIFRHRGNLARLRAGIEPKAQWTQRGQ